MDRAEAAGLGLSLAGHVALIAVLALGLFTLTRPPVVPPPAIDVDIVADDVALQSATPQPAPPAPRVAPEVGPPEEAAPPEPVVAPPVPRPEPAPRVTPAPAPRPTPMAKPAPVRPAPPVAKPVTARPAPVAAPADNRPRRRPGIDRSLVAGLRDTPGAPTARPSPSPAPAAAAPIGPAQLAGLAAAIRRQVQPCADRIVSPGPGAERIVTKLNLQMRPDGSFAVAPRVISQVTDGDNARYGARVGELARAAFVQCAPFELPAALYDGWKNINLNYKLPE